jgi:hypothetical protein
MRFCEILFSDKLARTYQLIMLMPAFSAMRIQPINRRAFAVEILASSWKSLTALCTSFCSIIFHSFDSPFVEEPVGVRTAATGLIIPPYYTPFKPETQQVRGYVCLP